MPRRRRAEIREIQPDGVYNSTLAEKFINSMMWDGKKTTSQRIFYSAMDAIKERSNDDPLKLFKKAVENCKPLLEVKTRRVGGANYQVPIEVLLRVVESEPAGLYRGPVELADGRVVPGILFGRQLAQAHPEITEHGGWRQYLARTAT